MNPPRVRRRIRSLVRKWRQIIVPDYGIEHHWNPADCRSGADLDYKTLHLHWNEARIARELSTEKHLEQEVIHELSHGIVWRLARRADDRLIVDGENLEESTTTAVERAIWSAYQLGKANN